MSSRGWCFTVNNYSDMDQIVLRNLGVQPYVKYLVFGREVAPETGTPHLQGLVIFKNVKTFTRTVALLPPGTYVDRMNGSSYQASQYCKKDGDFEEIGVAPQQRGQAGGQATKQKFQDAWDLALNNEIESIDADIRIQYYSTLRRIAKDYMKKPDPLDNVCGLWIYGPTGTGKTHTVATQAPDRYIKPLNKWWDGYQGESVVHLDEMCPTHTTWIAPFLKIWADKWPFAAEVKGGAIQIRPERIIITSNYAIEEMNFAVQDYDAIKRRFVQVFKERDQNIII